MIAGAFALTALMLAGCKSGPSDADVSRIALGLVNDGHVVAFPVDRYVVPDPTHPACAGGYHADKAEVVERGDNDGGRLWPIKVRLSGTCGYAAPPGATMGQVLNPASFRRDFVTNPIPMYFGKDDYGVWDGRMAN
jgi:hypothetical protein